MWARCSAFRLAVIVVAGAVVPLSVAATAPPAPNRPIPTGAANVARALESTTDALYRSIDTWRNLDSGAAPPLLDVTLHALYQQRIYRMLSANRTLARAVIRRLPGTLARQAQAITTAARDLARLARPVPGRVFRTGPARPAGVLLDYYAEAQRRFGPRWDVLAAINFVESAFGRVRSPSVAGAIGPMQFLPSTWRVYGRGGNVQDPRAAILGAANFLRAHGAPRSYRRALYSYNHSWAYVDAVLRYARIMRLDRRVYYSLYSWQVFVRTPAGSRRLTGPGR